MGAELGPHLHVDGDSVVHRLPAHVKLVGLVTFVLLVVALPRDAHVARLVMLAVAAAVVVTTRVPLRHVAARLVVETPFVVFALVLPFVATGPAMEVGPFTVSRDGVEASIALLLTATTSVLMAVAFATTTSSRDLVRALQHLRLPDRLVQILAFMVRYLGVVGSQAQRMKVARESRAFTARSVRSWPVIASSAGALFIRSYERGERVHLAMMSRGYNGRMPVTDPLHAHRGDWSRGLVPATLALVALITVHVL
ncbi:putative integral membrane transport protein [Janibacter sp. HTCC2649]|uniref:cobalt ECF transporter T component CbiQ n=1 Tax=Janibacter sp. HTCC2649 TaxID=313589 RepID=UPI000066ED58|nr:cobalt ECF transporter T component CbiQ [Janibacter sp. HTCC2649]EAP99123.1 putative integral membrane transport protein [Janibacter sp. HTCC2649]